MHVLTRMQILLASIHCLCALSGREVRKCRRRKIPRWVKQDARVSPVVSHLCLVLTHVCGLCSRTDRCLDCPAGKYGNQQAAAPESACTDCSAGSFSDVHAATSSAVCQVCGSNLFSKAGATACSFWCVLVLGLATAADTISQNSASSCVLNHLSTLLLCKLISLLFSCSVH